MYDNLRSRVSRIISVGVSAVIGAIEGLSPEGVMEEAIREVEEAMHEVRAELDRVLSSRHIANKQLIEKNNALQELEAQIQVAVNENRDDLATAGIAKQLDIEAQIPVLSDTLADLNAKERELHSFIEALDAKRREMKAELATLRKNKPASPASADARDGQSPAAPGADNVRHIARKADNAVSTFERIMARESNLPLLEGSSLDQGAKLADLSKLSRENRIKERLAAIKAIGKPQE